MASNLEGVAAMKAKLLRIAKRFPDIVGAALFMEGQIEMTEAKRRTPVDTGALRASGFVQEPRRGFGDNISVTLSFGGVADSYAVPVHENLEAHHRVGQAKYLESTILESAPYLAARVAARIALNERLL